MSLLFAAPEKRQLNGSVYTLPLIVAGPDALSIYKAWPRAMRFAGIQQTVRLDCLVPAEGGRLRDCIVMDEGEAGRGFGAAALSLSQLFDVRAGGRDGRKTPVREEFLIRFQCACAPEMMSWEQQAFTRTPSAAQIAAVYPERALAQKVSGAASIQCAAIKGDLSECKILKQTDNELGFGEAALKLAPLYRAKISKDSNLKTTVSYTVIFNAPLPAPPTTPTEPLVGGFTYSATRLQSPSPQDIERYYPERALRLEKNGRVLLRCRSLTDNKIGDCKITEETPPELGFGEAALKIVDKYTFSPELINGERTGYDSSLTAPVNFQLN